MKKILFFIQVFLLAMVGKASAQTTYTEKDVEEMAYAMGVSTTDGLVEYLVEKMNVDTTYMDSFVKGLVDGAEQSADKERSAYFAGIQIGQQIAQQMVAGINKDAFGEDAEEGISLKTFLKGFVDGIKATPEEMEKAKATAASKMGLIKQSKAMKEFSGNKMAGEKFLEENRTKAGVRVLPGGVQYKVLKEGYGAMPCDTSMVTVHYEGRTIDGVVFDSSYEKGSPIDLRANQVIRGFTDALVNMPVGSIWEVYIPESQAYGERQVGDIQPFSALIFKIELISIKK